jgi:uncharacterized protein (TIGR02679 family)
VDAPADSRLQRLLGGEALASLRARLRQRLERGVTGTFRLGGLNGAERHALASLLGRRARTADSMTLDIGELDAVLRHAGVAATLREALERLDGPIVDRKVERTALQVQWQALRECCADERLAAWIGQPRSLALLKRLGRSPGTAGKILDAAQAVLGKLPAAGTPRSRLAAEVLGDAHGLDSGRPVASVVLAALRWENAEAADDEMLANDDSARDVWAAAGVLVNELARPALFLNLPVAEGFHPPTSGEPGYLSLRALLRVPPCWDVAARHIYVCENPNLVAIAADALGARCAPLVCTDGMPGAAQRTLLFQLARAGARLQYHGDFDWAGLKIGNWVMRACGAQPWRYGTADYLTAIGGLSVPGRSLGAESVEADWDSGLAKAMRTDGRAIDEEAVAAILIRDLEGAGR